MRPSTRIHLLIVAATLALGLGLTACGFVFSQGESPPLRPTVIVITAAGPYFAAFDEPGDWLVGEGAGSQGRVEEGRYLLSIAESNTLAWTHQQRIFGDAVYEVEATLLHGAEASGFGLLLLGSSDLRSFLYCTITGDGRYDVGYCDNGCETQESLIGGYKLAPAILPDNQTNHLRVELAAGELTFIVNGASVSHVKDLTYTEGLLGLVGESSAFGGMEVAFDNLRVSE
jgi:hypothetical protein